MRKPGGPTDQGYGWTHQKERAHWARVVAEADGVDCRARVCLMPTRWIRADEPWDLGHNEQRTGWSGPEHVRCNRSAGAHNSNRTGNPGARYRRRRRRRKSVIHQDVSVDVADL